MFARRTLAALLLFACLHPGSAHAQTPATAPAPQAPDVAATPGAVSTPPRSEPPVPGLSRRDDDTIALALAPGRTLLLHDFDFNGEPVPTGKMHLRQLAPGVLELSSAAWTAGYWHFSVADRAHFFGLGEHGDTLDRAGTVARNLVAAPADARGAATPAPVPFYLSSGGYGLWLDTAGDAAFDFNLAQPGEVVVDATTTRLRILLFTGGETPGSFPAFLSAFATATGMQPALPPVWAFAPWQVLRGTAEEAQKAAEAIRTAHEPVGVLLPETAALRVLAAALHPLGFKLVVAAGTALTKPPSVPGTEPDDGYTEAAAQGLLVRAADGSPLRPGDPALDLSNPNARRWWSERTTSLLAAGADGLADPPQGLPASPTDAAAMLFDHSDPRTVRNRAAQLEHTAAAALLGRQLNSEGVVLARQAGTGAQPLTMLAGPPASLRASLRAGLSAGLSGLPLWGPGPLPGDGPASARWLEFAAYTPLMVLPPLTPQEAAGTGALRQRYERLHLTLMPYLYAAAEHALETGEPVMRPLLLDAPNDMEAVARDDEYLLGPDLLVAPVLDAATAREVYLPAGAWVELTTGRTTDGPATLVISAPLDSIPVFARAGAILPTLPEDVETLVPAAATGNKTIPALDNRRVYTLPGAAAAQATRMVDFEGRTLVRSGDTLTITPPANGPALPVPGTAAHMAVRLADAHEATLDGKPLTLHPGPGDQQTAEFDLTGPATLAWK